LIFLQVQADTIRVPTPSAPCQLRFGARTLNPFLGNVILARVALTAWDHLLWDCESRVTVSRSHAIMWDERHICASLSGLEDECQPVIP